MSLSKVDSEIKKWVELYSDKLYSWALYKTSNIETAEDLVQDTFVVAFQSYNKFERKSEPQTWLFAILNNKIADYFRKVYRQATITESQINKDESKSFFDNFFDSFGKWKKEHQPTEWNNEQLNLMDDSDFTNVLQSCLEKLPDNWKAAIQLKYLDEKKRRINLSGIGYFSN